MLNVRDFGAFGDDVHDDTAAFLDAIAFAETRPSAQILVPAGSKGERRAAAVDGHLADA